MKRTTVIALATFVLGGAFTFHACSKDDDGVEEPDDGFVAENGDFANFIDWGNPITTHGDNDALAGMAHVPDPSATRDIYFKDGQEPIEEGEYPQGTIIVKHSYDGEGEDEFTAMVKRGGDFNSEGGGWEWFMLEADGRIMGRGAALMEGGCQSCHNNAATDRVFTHAQFVAAEEDFAGFMDWPSIQTTGDNPALAGAAHVRSECYPGHLLQRRSGRGRWRISHRHRDCKTFL